MPQMVSANVMCHVNCDKLWYKYFIARCLINTAIRFKLFSSVLIMTSKNLYDDGKISITREYGGSHEVWIGGRQEGRCVNFYRGFIEKAARSDLSEIERMLYTFEEGMVPKYLAQKKVTLTDFAFAFLRARVKELEEKSISPSNLREREFA
jgi:hypothetical protein